MSEINEMLVRIERAIEYYEKDTDDFGMPIFLRDIAKVLTEASLTEIALRNELILTKASAEGAGSLLLDVQRDCIAAVQRANAAEKEAERYRVALRDIAIEEYYDDGSFSYHDTLAAKIARAVLESKP